MRCLDVCVQVAAFVDEAVQIAQKLRTAYGPKLKDFKDALATQVRDVVGHHNGLGGGVRP